VVHSTPTPSLLFHDMVNPRYPFDVLGDGVPVAVGSVLVAWAAAVAVDGLGHQSLDIIEVRELAEGEDVVDVSHVPVADAGRIGSDVGHRMAAGTLRAAREISCDFGNAQTVAWRVAVDADRHMVDEVARAFGAGRCKRGCLARPEEQQ